jgi:hypothetical protein
MCVLGDCSLLVCGYHEDPDSAVGSAAFCFFRHHSLVCFRVESNVYLCQSGTYSLAQRDSILSYSAGKNQGVHRIEARDIRTDALLDAVARDVYGRFCPFVTSACHLLQVPDNRRTHPQALRKRITTPDPRQPGGGLGGRDGAVGLDCRGVFCVE